MWSISPKPLDAPLLYKEERKESKSSTTLLRALFWLCLLCPSAEDDTRDDVNTFGCGKRDRGTGGFLINFLREGGDALKAGEGGAGGGACC